jgi:hypothetical protein
MKSTVKRIFWAICQRSILATWFINLARYNLSALRALPHRFSDHRWDYAEFGSRWAVVAGFRNDRAANFFITAALEKPYDFIIEVGALDGWRCQKLARLFPNAKVYGLDINVDYTGDVTRSDNLTTAHDDLATLVRLMAQHRGQSGLLCSTGTLTYYDIARVRELFTTLAAFGVDLAIDEPNAAITEQSRTVSFKRTMKSFYHPYIALMHEAGYVIPDRDGQQIDHTWGMHAEERTTLFGARPAANA